MKSCLPRDVLAEDVNTSKVSEFKGTAEAREKLSGYEDGVQLRQGRHQIAPCPWGPSVLLPEVDR